ncbi:hypothetical protein [Tabrizicola sp. YIM 78059]|uniref:hypothetical protein n=1 Tax=Tabrizicola sp. YIM 78059 TaxID=2529861 RepID=UPI0010AAA2A7|nr:hypothetical protein [Tabrizicola sp. YIM 78059]
MTTRLRLLKVAAVLLYSGPLFAGLSGFGWGTVAPFVAMFVVWLIMLRPEQWPSTAQEWATPAAWLSALIQVLSQVLLVVILMATGRGIGALAGFLPVLNPIFPLAVSFMALPLCRMLWNAYEAADRGIFLDDEAEAAQAPRAAAQAAAAIVPLLNLPDTAPDAEVAALVNRVMQVPGAALRLKALTAALARPDRSHAALRRALVVWASEPEVVAPGLVPDSMRRAFSIADGNADLLRLYLPRAVALIAAFPDRAPDFPTPERLREAAEQDLGADPASDLPAHLRADLRDGLRALAQAVETALRPGAAPAEAHAGAMAAPSARIA